MRVALAQINVTVGDIAGNVSRSVRAIQDAEARGATCTLLPELAVTGYPPEDLLAKAHFVDENMEGLEQIAGSCRHSAIVGFVDRVGDALYNASALCGNGRVLQIYHKRRLPNYSVFDERRYFVPGESQGLVELGGTMFSTTICEDIWVPDLVRVDVDSGASALLNISASPFHAGKAQAREDMLRQRARETGTWLAYCNLVGGQDELIFDGRSVVISASGDVIARGAAFAEDLLFADMEPDAQVGASAEVARHLDANEEVWGALTLGVRDYLGKNGFADAVIGLSGGIDSALTAAIAVDALGAQHVHGVMMPSRYSSGGSLADARALAANLGIEAFELPVEAAFQAFESTLATAFIGRESDITEENLQARVRGTLLMALSNKFGWIVLATGNKSELSVGYSTLYGDMVGGFAPLKDVFKTRVYELARWRNSSADGCRTGGADSAVIPEATLTKPPSAELRPGQTDQDTLPPYGVLDVVLERYVEQDASQDSIAGEGFDAEMVTRICRLVDVAEYKRRQGPMGIRITPKAFGKDRRMPVTNGYRG